MTKQDVIDHLNTYASAKIYLSLNIFVDFPTFPTMNVLDRTEFIAGLTAIPETSQLSIAIDTDNNLLITDL